MTLRQRCARWWCLAWFVAIGCGAQNLPQNFPQKTVTLIAPFAPGGSADGISRILARELGQSLGQSVVVENKPGAGGATGLIALSRAPADGHALGMGATGAITIGPHLPEAPPLNPSKQLSPLVKVADIPLVLVASNNAGLQSVQDLLNRAKTTEVPVANAGQFTAHHLAVELLASMAQLKLVSVPYRGSAPAIQDVVGGQIGLAMVDLTAALPHIKSGAVKALAVTSATRTRLATTIPTLAEAGVPDYAAPAWMGLFLPKGVPQATVDKLSNDLMGILAKPEVQQQILALAAEPQAMNANAFTHFIEAESQRWSRVIAALPKGTR